jgi:signal transduction histidine kinase
LLKDEFGKPIGLVGIARDITERKKAEERLLRSEKDTRHAYNRASFYKDLFAHDMNNILQNILGSAEIALLFLNDIDQLGNAKTKLKKIQEQVDRGANLVSNVQKLSMLDEVKSSFKPIDVLDTLNQVIKNMHEGYSEKSLDIRVDSPEKPLLVIGNELLIDVFENLLANAIRHNENSEVEIEIKLTQQEKDDKLFLRMEFRDNGIGIEDNRKDMIFERGYNGKKSVHGMGLGLSLVKQIISSYNGDIWVEDRVKGDHSEGSNFILLIPRGN